MGSGQVGRFVVEGGADGQSGFCVILRLCRACVGELTLPLMKIYTRVRSQMAVVKLKHVKSIHELDRLDEAQVKGSGVGKCASFAPHSFHLQDASWSGRSPSIS
jgi:hypothetical protein